MNKKRLGLSLGLLACAGFFLIILQYKVTELSLQIPTVEENYHQLKQQLEGLELQVRSLKNPKRLFEEKEKQLSGALSFPKQGHVMALHIEKIEPKNTLESVKSNGLNLPLAKVFP